MDKQKFDIGYKVTIIVVFLVVGSFIGYTFLQISKDGKSCLQQPLVWGAKVAVEKYDVGHVQCSCNVGDQVFSFDESSFEIKQNRFANSNIYINNSLLLSSK